MIEVRASRADEAYLPLVLPVEARRFRVHDPELSYRLAFAGAELVNRNPEVEIGPVDQLSGDAPCVIVSLEFDPAKRDISPRLIRAADRIVTHVRTRAWTLGTRRSLGQRGYTRSVAVLWDIGQTVRLPDACANRSRRLVERFPQRAVVVGVRDDGTSTLMQASLGDARRFTARPLQPVSCLTKSGLLLVMTEEEVLRVAVGPARRRIEMQAEALQHLRATNPPDEVSRRVPWVLGLGRTGLAQWSVERLLPGHRAAGSMSKAVLDDCLEFLVALHRVGIGVSEDAASAESHAYVLAHLCSPNAARALIGLARRVDCELVDLPRGFGHGDFWHGNLLVNDEGLVGVVDWDAAKPGRLPLIDYLCLRHNASRRRGAAHWSAALIDQLLPWANTGGDAWALDYCRRIGVEPSIRLFRAALVAYWLEHVAYQFQTYADIMERPAWRSDFDRVLRALVEGDS